MIENLEKHKRFYWFSIVFNVKGGQKFKWKDLSLTLEK